MGERIEGKMGNIIKAVTTVDSGAYSLWGLWESV
jgi:hypothetical protein